MRQKVLVTGAGGYVGSVLVRDLLTRGYDVRAVDNFWKGQCDSLIGLTDREHFEFMTGDVTNEEDVKRMVDSVDYIVHLAAIVGYPACKKHPVLSHMVNVGGMENILKHRRCPLVFASTGSVYGSVEGLCTEDSPLNAVSQYGLDKKIAEDMVTSSSDTVSLRFATGFGVSPCMRVNLLVNDLVMQAVSNRCISIFQADFKRTFVHVKDMSRAFIWGFEGIGNLKHKVYNVGDESLNWSKRELAEYIKDRTGAFVSYADFGSDGDLRNYTVSYKRLNDEDFKCVHTMEDGINHLIKTIPLLQIRHQYE